MTNDSSLPKGGELESIMKIADTPIRSRVVAIEENATPEIMESGMSTLEYRLEAKVWPDRIYGR